MSTATDFADRPLAVLALGGNALSPPDADVEAYAPERLRIATTAAALNQHLRAGFRLLIVHGNGPQVGRLLRHDPEHANLDIHVAQTQGELGYLLTAALDEPTVGVLTRVIVGADPGPPVKAIGPVLRERPAERAAARAGAGWRVVVPSPEPMEIVEEAVIKVLLRSHHVVAAGGGGVPLSGSGEPVAAVIDKDRVACLLAISLGAAHLVFATNVDHVCADYGTPRERALEALTLTAGQQLIDQGQVAAGSMLPKLDSALRFVRATGQVARICGLADLDLALGGEPGTSILP